MKRSELASLDDLRAFETVARLGSVRAAAVELSLTHGAVSRRVAKLSADLGLRLLRPAGRGLRLTPEGAQLAEASRRGFGLIRETLDRIRARAAPGPVILSCERSLAMRWLIPRLSAFQDRHPEIVVHLSTGGGALDFARDRVALAIRRLDFPIDPGWTLLPLMPERVGPVLPPGLGARFSAGDYVALGARTRPRAWSDWLDRQPGAPRPRTLQLLDHHFLMVEAALAGLGVALSPQALVAEDVAKGRLLAPHGFVEDGTDYALIHPGGAVPEAVAVLRDWLLRQPGRA